MARVSGSEVRTPESLPSPFFDDHRARTVAEKHAGGAVRPIDQLAHRLCGNDENGVCLTRSDKGIGDLHAIEHAHTGGVQIERGRVRADRLGDRARERGGICIPAHGGAQDEVDLFPVGARIFEGALCGEDGQIVQPLVRENVAAMYSRPRIDPLVRRVQKCSEIVVGNNFFGKGAARARDIEHSCTSLPKSPAAEQPQYRRNCCTFLKL